MERANKVFLSLDGMIVVQTGNAFQVYSADGELAAFLNHEIVSNMILIELASVPVKIWKRQRKYVEKMHSKKY